MFGFTAILFGPGWFFLVRPLCHAGLTEYCFAAFRPFILAAFAVGSAYLLAAPLESGLLRLFVGVALSAPLYAALSFVANREWVVAMLELAGRARQREGN